MLSKSCSTKMRFHVGRLIYYDRFTVQQLFEEYMALEQIGKFQELTNFKCVTHIPGYPSSITIDKKVLFNNSRNIEQRIIKVHL